MCLEISHSFDYMIVRFCIWHYPMLTMLNLNKRPRLDDILAAGDFSPLQQKGHSDVDYC
nr:hypothetical protein IBNDOAIG_00015 [uncultured bacterium]